MYVSWILKLKQLQEEGILIPTYKLWNSPLNMFSRIYIYMYMKSVITLLLHFDHLFHSDGPWNDSLLSTSCLTIQLLFRQYLPNWPLSLDVNVFVLQNCLHHTSQLAIQITTGGGPAVLGRGGEGGGGIVQNIIWEIESWRSLRRGGTQLVVGNSRALPSYIKHWRVKWSTGLYSETMILYERLPSNHHHPLTV